MTKLYEAHQHILIHTGYADPAPHRHMAAHIILSLEDTITVNQLSCRGVMIPSGLPHQVDTNGSPVLVFLYDSTSCVSRRITKVQAISDTDCRKIVDWYRAWEPDKNPDEYHLFERKLHHLLGLPQSSGDTTDPRIADAIHTIRSRASEPLSCREVAASVFLSQSRFSHLFKKEIGMTFSAYLIFQRLMAAYTQLLHGTAITKAALDAGFSSPSHFADTSRRVFGLSAGTFQKDLAFFKIK